MSKPMSKEDIYMKKKKLAMPKKPALKRLPNPTLQKNQSVPIEVTCKRVLKKPQNKSIEFLAEKAKESISKVLSYEEKE